MSSAFLSLSVSPEEDEEPEVVELEEDEGVGVLGPLSLSAFTLAEFTSFPACGLELSETFLASPGLERAQVSIGFAELAAGFGAAEAAGLAGASAGLCAAAGLCAGVGASAGLCAAAGFAGAAGFGDVNAHLFLVAGSLASNAEDDVCLDPGEYLPDIPLFL